ncbi:MAG: DUF58 domain-containing protein [Bacillota bacterium]
MLFDEDYLRQLERLELALKKVSTTQHQGSQKSSYAGSGLEFSGFRPYLPGDDYRYIDWNLYSRLEQLFLKLFQEEKESVYYLLVDKSKSMSFGQPPKMETALKTAGALGYIGLLNYERVGAGFFAEELGAQFKPGKGKKRVHQLFDFLSQNSEVRGKTDMNQAFSLFNYQYKIPGTVIILSDFFDEKGYREGLSLLAQNGWQVYLIQILSPTEVNPELNGEYKLFDSETGEKKEVNIDQKMIQKYKNSLQNYRQELLDYARYYGMYYFFLETDFDFENTIRELIQGKLLK